MYEHDKIYIDGAWVPSTGKGTIDVFDSTNGEVIGRIPDGTAEDVDKAAIAARAAFDDWSQRSPEERGKFCTRIAEGLSGRMDEIATIVTREAGMPKWLSLMVQAGLPTRAEVDQMSGPVVVDAMANWGPQSTQCTGTATHEAVWRLDITVAGTPLRVPLFVDHAAGAEAAFSSVKIQFCLPGRTGNSAGRPRPARGGWETQGAHPQSPRPRPPPQPAR